MVAVNMVTESGEDGVVGRYVYITVYHVFYLPLDIYQIKEPRLRTELEDDTQTGMFDGFIVSEGREKTRFLDVILAQDRKYLPLEEMDRRWFIWLSHGAKIPLSEENGGNFSILASRGR